MLTLLLAVSLQAAPTADELMARYAARVKDSAAQGASLRYRKVHTEYDVSDPLHPVRLEKKEMRVWTEHGTVTEKVISINDGPVLNPTADRGDLSLDESLTNRFRYELIRAEPEVCPDCYLMSYEPREKQPGRRSIPEEIISRTGGTIMMDASTGTMLWLKGTLRQPFSKWIFGKFYDADVDMHQELIFGAPMTVSARIRVHYSRFGFNSYRLFELSFFGFEPETATPPQ